MRAKLSGATRSLFFCSDTSSSFRCRLYSGKTLESVGIPAGDGWQLQLGWRRVEWRDLSQRLDALFGSPKDSAVSCADETELSAPQTQRDKGEGSYGDLGASPSTFPVAQMIKNPPSMRVTCVWSLGREDTLEEGTATHSSILAWKISWTEEPGGVQSMGSQRVRHDWASRWEDGFWRIKGHRQFGGPTGRELQG